ncbi:MAG: hypothetical protein RL757_1977 [Bacteroidota bacterium]|jgi:hypothetical protein
MKKTFTNYFYIFLFLSVSSTVKSQDIVHKKLEATQLLSEERIKIDGKLDESAWLRAQPTDQFLEFEPTPFQKTVSPSEVRVAYNNRAIYIAAKLFDAHPDSVMRQLTPRDKTGQTDLFGVTIDAYQDGQNSVNFFVTAAGVQLDSKYYGGSTAGEDFSWSAVWSSAVSFGADGWTAEFEIPYSALRFPVSEVQNWRINFIRQNKRFRTIEVWNPTRPDLQSFVAQYGDLTGIKGIKPPIRLQATPFLATYANNTYDKKSNPKSDWQTSISGGLDIKYGLNDAFTLDMTLIPDFGQVQFDQKVLNLSPFEIRFDENRPFFTEGVELFNKANFFYSRRVGGRLLYYNKAYNNLGKGETVTSNPDQAQLYNATKISGRTRKGLGVGFFNATAAPTFAKIDDIETGNSRRFLTNPLTNYNVVSFDQNLPNNSSITLQNTNVWREGNDYEANTTGVIFNLRDKPNQFSLSGRLGLSQKYFKDSADFGQNVFLRVAKISGIWQHSLAYSLESDRYDINDLGFLQAPNESNFTWTSSFTQYKPKGIFNRYNISFVSEYRSLYRPNVYDEFNIACNSFFLTKKILAFGWNLEYLPFNKNDYFEPRNNFKSFFKNQELLNVGGFISTDWRKKYAIDVNTSFRFFSDSSMFRWRVSVSPRLRFGDKAYLVWNIETLNQWGEAGFVNKKQVSNGYESVKNDILFGRRDQFSVSNAPLLTWNFNKNTSFTFRLRHYWAQVRYKSFETLQRDGSLKKSEYDGQFMGISQHDERYTSFTIDAGVLWRFAPGSDLSVVWKNAINNSDGSVRRNYFSDAEDLFNHAQQNSLSVKMIYFLDYALLRPSKNK